MHFDIRDRRESHVDASGQPKSHVDRRDLRWYIDTATKDFAGACPYPDRASTRDHSRPALASRTKGDGSATTRAATGPEGIDNAELNLLAAFRLMERACKRWEQLITLGCFVHFVRVLLQSSSLLCLPVWRR